MLDLDLVGLSHQKDFILRGKNPFPFGGGGAPFGQGVTSLVYLRSDVPGMVVQGQSCPKALATLCQARCLPVQGKNRGVVLWVFYKAEFIKFPGASFILRLSFVL